MHNGSGQANRFSSLAACALAAVVFCSCASADVAIVKQGKPLAKIVLGHKATGVEKHAAVELQKYIKQISGAALEIAGEDAAGAKGTFVLIGTPESSKLVSRLSDGLDIKSVKYDGFVIKEVAHGGASYLVLASPEARGCLYAVYDLLESALGVGFFWAGDRVPQAADVSITAAAQKVSSPYFEYREYLQGCAVQYSWVTYWDFRQWKKEIDWAAKHKFNILWYPSAGMLIEKRVYKRLGVDLGATTDGDRREADFIRQIINYARALGMKVVGPGFTGSVKAELKKVYPDAKYIEIQWLDLPPRLNLYPTDPLFKQLGQYLIEEYTREYGTDHLYDVGAYDETSPGKTRQEKQAIKVHFAKAVCEYIRTADPEGIWHMSGWTFQDPQFWPKQDVKLFMDTIPDEMFLVNDVYADTNPKYQDLDYFYGKNWGFGVLHSMGGENHMHGQMRDLINQAQAVTKDAQAEKCINFYVNPEIIHHNPLYYELAADLGWSPRQVNLDDFLGRYAALRYGQAVSKKMKAALALLTDSVYSDMSRDADKYGWPQYWKRLGSHFAPWMREKYSCILPLRKAMEIMLEVYPEQKDNPLFLRDLVDVSKQYVGELFNYHVVQLYKNFTWELPENFEKEAQILDKLLGLQERLLSCWQPYQVRTIIDSSCAYSPHVNKQDVANDVKLNYSALGKLKYYPTLLDYACRDLHELLRDYYRPRVAAYVGELRRCLQDGETNICRKRLEDAYLSITTKWVNAPLNRSGYGSSDQVSAAVGDILAQTTVPEVGVALSCELANGGFEAGKRGWNINMAKLAETKVVEGNAAEGTKSLHFKPLDGMGHKNFSYDQQVGWKSQSKVAVRYYLVSHTNLANASLKIEAFEPKGRKIAQLIYFLGGDSWDTGNDGPEKTGGFYAVKKKVNSELNKWHLLVADPQKDLDAVHGDGLWDKLPITSVRVSVGAWCLERDDNSLEVFFDDIKIVPPAQPETK